MRLLVIDINVAFTAVNLLKAVSDLLAYLPTEVMNLFKAKVSLDRISKYLEEQDIDKYCNKNFNVSDANSESDTVTDEHLFCGFKNAEFMYHGGDEVTGESDFKLRNINIEFKIGKLNLIAGSTGAGKSSLLLALLGELKTLSGSFSLPVSKDGNGPMINGLSNSCAYAAQTAWLFNGTIRDNIVFGERFDLQRYERVINVCALRKDFENFEGGDLTEIGEKGINLSGGQKQRISLARVCYSKASFVLLDDPLSAVDAPTARYLLHQCILKFLNGRTVILVSHSTQLVAPWAEFVVVMENGSVRSKGTPLEVTTDVNEELLYGLELEKDVFDEEKEGVLVPAASSCMAKAGTGTTLVQDEEKATGSVQLSLYKKYFVAAGGLLFVTVLLVSFVAVSGTRIANDWWLKQWTDHNQNIADNLRYYISMLEYPLSGSRRLYSSSNLRLAKFSDSSLNGMGAAFGDQHDTFYYIGVYAVLGLSVIIMSNLQMAWVFYGGVTAARKLHNSLLHRVLHAPLRFFEVTPIGRILNRFSKDIESIDNSVMDTIKWFFEKILDGAIIIAVIGSIVPPFLILVPFISGAFVYVAYVYLRCSRELKRFESISRSPIYAQFSETLSGVCTIRAYCAEVRFSKAIIRKINDNHKPFFFVWAANRWLCSRTDLMSTVFVFFAGLFAVFSNVSPGWAAMIITYALQFTYSLIWVIRMQAEVEMNMNSGA